MNLETTTDISIGLVLSATLNGVKVGHVEFFTPDVAGTQLARLMMAESHVVSATNSATLSFKPDTNTGLDGVIIRGICVELIAPVGSGHEYKFIN